MKEVKKKHRIGESCPKCKTIIEDNYQCRNCKLVFSRYRETSRTRNHFQSKKNVLRVYITALPLALIVAYILSKSFLNYPLSFIHIWIHEFGHAIFAWMSGVAAAPIGFGSSGMTFYLNNKPSIIVFLICNFFLFTSFKYCKNNGSVYLSNISLLLIFPSFYFTWFRSPDQCAELLSLGGLAGELILPTFMIISFYFKMPAKFNWKKISRWIFLFIGFYILLSSTGKWLHAFELNSLTPLGVSNSSSAVLGVPGDLYQLRVKHNWSLFKILFFYKTLCLVSWLTISSVYVYFIVDFKKRIPRVCLSDLLRK